MDDNLTWSVYGRTIYDHKCKDLKICPHKYDNNCYCSNYLSVSPTIIAKCGFFCGEKLSINKKCYIGFGEICSICLDPIISKTTAWLTPCGHPFHRKCVMKNYNYRQIRNLTLEYTNAIPCPVCRYGLIECCVGLENLNKYNTENGLDKLENFWLRMNDSQYLSCYKCKKGMGLNLSCDICECYRETGYT